MAARAAATQAPKRVRISVIPATRAVEVDREHSCAADRRVHGELPLAERGAADRREVAAAAIPFEHGEHRRGSEVSASPLTTAPGVPVSSRT